jgi:hypothetical protein
MEGLEERSLPSVSTYVGGLYQTLLGRSASTAEVNFWSSKLDNGNNADKRHDVTQAFVNSDEFRTKLIRSKYQTLLGRTVDPGGLNASLAALRAGANEREIDVVILSSAEFFQKSGGNNTAWLAAVYQKDLGRAIDSKGQSAWLGQLQAGASRASVARLIANSREKSQNDVANAFFGFLGTKTGTDADKFITDLGKGKETVSDVLAAIGSSSAVAKKFGLS